MAHSAGEDIVEDRPCPVVEEDKPRPAVEDKFRPAVEDRPRPAGEDKSRPAEQDRLCPGQAEQGTIPRYTLVDKPPSPYSLAKQQVMTYL